MNRTTNILFLFVTCILLGACQSNDTQATQMTVSNKVLNGTKWKLTEPDLDIYITFTNSTITKTIIYPKETVTTELLYYISDSVPSTFDFSKTGIYKEGSRIILKGKNHTEFIGYDIVKFENDTLALQYKAPPKTIIGGDEINLLYTRIK